MTFSWDRTWGELVALTRAHVEILLIVAGLFIFVPAFVVALYFKPVGIDQFNGATMRAINAYFAANWLPLLLTSVVARMGEGTILAVLLNRGRQTVSKSLSSAAKLLFPFVILSLIANLAIVAGLFVLIVPGIYLVGRLAVAGPAMIAERESNPLNAIARSLALTRGRGWRVAGLVIFVFVIAYILTGAVKAAITVLLALFVPSTAIAEVTALVSALLDASVSVVSVLLVAAIYRQLTSSKAT